MLAGWSDRFEEALVGAMVRRLGVKHGNNDREIAAALITALSSRAETIDRIFFDWRGGRNPGGELYPADAFRALARALEGRERPPSHPYWSDAAPCSLHIEEVEAIWDAIATSDDWQPFDDKVNAIRRMGDAMSEDAATA